MAQMSGVLKGTGREREEWFDLLDGWGAGGRPYREIAAWLTGEHGLSRWWAQKLIVEYEQSRGLRSPGARRHGTFEVSATKTISVPIGQVFDAVVKASQREKWMGPAAMTLEASDRERSATFSGPDGGSRVKVSITEKESSKTVVVLTHDRLTDANEAQANKAMWRDRLADLKTYLES